MTRYPDASERLARSWDENAEAWTRTVRNHAIESRRVATDAAIVEAVLTRSPRWVLDVGCGEGWLTRALASRRIGVVGVDGSLALVEAARAAGGGEYRHMSYDELAADPAPAGPPFDAVVCNFSLLHEDIESLLRALAATLVSDGALLIQTVHPWTSAGHQGYANGWRTEAFSGFTEHFAQPMPWFFRTLSSWVETLRSAGLRIDQLIEPVHPTTKEPLSLLFITSRAGV